VKIATTAKEKKLNARAHNFNLWSWSACNILSISARVCFRDYGLSRRSSWLLETCYVARLLVGIG
jgi:hypothetical protein